MRVASLGLAAALLVAAAPGPGAGPDGGEGSNLLVNGSFEEGPDPGAFLPVNKDSTDIKGWTVTRGQIDYIGSFWPAADGKRSLDLHGSPGFGGVSQTFPTVKGQKYRVTFALAGNPEGTVPKKKLGVRAAGQSAEFTFDTTGKSTRDMGWETKTWEFTAADDRTTLELHTLMTEDESFGPALDNVVVVPLKQ